MPMGPGHSDLASPFCLVGRQNRSVIYSPAFSRSGAATARVRVLGAFTGSASDPECWPETLASFAKPVDSSFEITKN